MEYIALPYPGGSSVMETSTPCHLLTAVQVRCRKAKDGCTHSPVTLHFLALPGIPITPSCASSVLSPWGSSPLEKSTPPDCLVSLQVPGSVPSHPLCLLPTFPLQALISPVHPLPSFLSETLFLLHGAPGAKGRDLL